MSFSQKNVYSLKIMIFSDLYSVHTPTRRDQNPPRPASKPHHFFYGEAILKRDQFSLRCNWDFVYTPT
ncbi:hypothetical protein HMPREF3232_00872 [Fannyhessea vaginae]|nr:hypothetical protein HMPREF3232_00872 [Fannyhessea vaginae]